MGAKADVIGHTWGGIVFKRHIGCNELVPTYCLFR
eukprot:SAG25_NODE_8545_length_416_cov_1.274448_1_plen_34_part_01